jgi:hypothetical protein
LSKIIVGRHIEGITLNDLEYLLDENEQVIEFENQERAEVFLKSKGLTEEELYYLVFKEI